MSMLLSFRNFPHGGKLCKFLFYIILSAFFGSEKSGFFIMGRNTMNRIVKLTEFNRCSWLTDLAMTRDPTKVWDAYFNEKGAYDVRDKLRKPDITNYLQPVPQGNSTSYLVFPYFVVVRATCDSGYYDDSYYRIIMHGAYPTIVLTYFPNTARDSIRQSWVINSPGGLINIRPDKDHEEVPKNPFAPDCYLDMCYPAFVVPLVFLHIPIFDVKIDAMDVFSFERTRIHVSPYFARNTDESDIELGKRDPDPEEFFPIERINSTANPELLSQELMDELRDDGHFPLDKEDFFEPQYTFGSSPTIFLAGFYQPNLLIMLEPDLNTFRPLVWERNPVRSDGKTNENLTVFDHALSCRWLDKKYYNDDSLDIPIYSSGEGEFPDDLHSTYYRRRFAPHKYQHKNVPNVIFEAISLEDRLLLVTYSGLVVFYGDSNHTVYTDSALKAPSAEKLRKCFKFVRIARLGAQESDLIVAATYHYKEQQTFKSESGVLIDRSAEVIQEIWMGKFTAAGKPLEWIKPGETGNTEGLSEESLIPQVRQICWLVIRQWMRDFMDKKILTFDDNDCWVIDGSPAVGHDETIQVLVQMQVTHVPTKEYFEDIETRNEFNLIETDSRVTFYVIAQHSPKKHYSKKIWDIMSIVPRRPCVKAHRQNIKTIENFGSHYFAMSEASDETASPREEKVAKRLFKKNCHYSNRGRAYNDLYIDRMTYTRQNNVHLFLYGTKLVHSANGGSAFTFYQGFPSTFEEHLFAQQNADYVHEEDFVNRTEKYKSLMKNVKSHTIKVMAFDSGGHFAFLTSKRHLYLGTTGTIKIIRLRPSKGYSMIRTTLGSKPGLHDARPFSLIFDSQNRLFELVATVGSDKRVEDLMKRPVPWELIIANENFIRKLLTHVEEITGNAAPDPDKITVPPISPNMTFRGNSQVTGDPSNLQQSIAMKNNTAELEDDLMGNATTEDPDPDPSARKKRDIQNGTREADPSKSSSISPLDITSDLDLVSLPTSSFPLNSVPSVTSPSTSFKASTQGKVVSNASKPINVVAVGMRKFSTFCPFGDVWHQQNYTDSKSRLEALLLQPPTQHIALGHPLVHSSLMAFQASSYSLIHAMFLSPDTNTYSRLSKNGFTKWAKAKGQESQIGFFRYFSGDPEEYGIVMKPSSFKHLTDNSKVAFIIPDRYYLDYNQAALTTIKFHITIEGSLDKTDYATQKLESIQLTVDNGNGSILEVETERIVDAKHAAVVFKILFHISPQAHLKQSEPGISQIVVPVSFHLVGAFGNCFKTEGSSYIGDYISTAVYAGCQPQTLLQFNWNQTIRSLRFRNPEEFPGGAPSDCYNSDPACFYAKLPFVPHFEIYDSAKQTYAAFTGKYKFKVIAGGYSPDSLETYSESEQEAYNIPGKSDVSLIWSEWDMKSNSKVKTKQALDVDESFSHEVVLTAGKSAVKWTCHAFSPCARLWPRWSGETIFYFKVRVSNRFKTLDSCSLVNANDFSVSFDGDVDNTTLCLHEREIIIHLYGFTPAPEIQLLISILFCLLILLILYTMYICCRNNRKFWRANKVKFYGWIQVIVDTFPKVKKGQDMNDDLTQQMRRDMILMSLQGHLRVPVISSVDQDQRDSVTGGEREGTSVLRRRRPVHTTSSSRSQQNRSRKSGSKISATGGAKSKSRSRSRSRSTSASKSSDQDENTLPVIHPRHNPATWTDMIYDQIITKRLQAIIERNQERKKSILEKVEVKDSPSDHAPGKP